MDETYEESKMKKSKITKFSICKAHANVSLYKKPVQNSLELRITADQKTPGEVKDVTHLYKNVKLKLRGNNDNV
jgi:hypothetical protein|tara:strand:- start:224 stop:445 length:222 start_codon:yes stop_codon:yes gene_type:complete